MMRSLFAAVSGLRNHQVDMDVIGNNIANINTIGFKTGRALFQQMLSETIQGASRPNDGSAGTNPVQVGLGMSVATVSNNFAQGQLEHTGNMMDMAVQGDGFFVMRNGDQAFYGRAGAFGFDGQGRLTAGQGLLVQGWLADPQGNVRNGIVNDITLPFGQKSPARATTEVTLASNLDASSEALATITQTNALRATAQGADALANLFNSRGQSLGVQPSDGVTVSYAATGATLVSDLSTQAGTPMDLANGDTIVVGDGTGTANITYNSSWTLADLAANVQTALASIGTETDIQVSVAADGSLLYTNPAGGNNADVSVTLSVPGRSAFNSLTASLPVIDGTATARSQPLQVSRTLTNGVQFNNMSELAAAIQGALRLGSSTASVVFQNGRMIYDNSNLAGQNLNDLSITRPGASTTFADAMGLVGGNLDTGSTLQSDLLLDTASDSDRLIDLYSASGTSLGLTTGGVFSFDAQQGGTPVSQATFTVSGSGDGSSTDRSVQTLGGLLSELEDVLQLQTAGSATLQDGAIVIQGRSGLAHALSNLAFSAPGNNALAAATSFSQTQAATDVTHETSTRVYDALGQTHLLTMKFTKDNDTDNRWTWSASVDGGTITAGGTGSVTFRGDGTLESFATDDGQNLSFDPTNGANGPVVIDFNPGTRGGVDGITGFARESTTAITNQDGYAMGLLQSVSVDADGVLTGTFTNGTSRALAQIALANFKNSAGLEQDAGNGWVETANSGQPVLRRPGKDSDAGSISSGTLEMSNVDLAQEFTDMIVAQRGFQANARTVSVSDSMLQELVDLKR
ncbi:MAG: flagellar hook-basal body complex protein [bacterium]